ncbi:DUF1674 domain-containing protein [Sneathiella aquimaris]|uniref:DUF1674 domain-containing protein n=1 Tax=Sneathiella aquimaris TaxID=2599305 RepID=UPI001469CC4E|nr:succinate dehydrogenase assembly factor 4 [Sneathiella aquimaris]
MDPKKIDAQDQAAESVEEKTEEKTKAAHKLEQADGEIGGPSGLEPTRYGDWERKGIVSDF